MISRSHWSLQQRLLVYVAERLGPALDVVDGASVGRLLVRDLIANFAKEPPFASPAEVRSALEDLHDDAVVEAAGDESFSAIDDRRAFVRFVMQADAAIGLTCRGLVAARNIVPNCGRPVAPLTITTRRGRPMLDFRLDTGVAARDRKFNASPTIASVALAVLVWRPTAERPLLVDECVLWIERLNAWGAPRRPGPRAEQAVSPDAIREALDALGKTLNVSRSYFGEDKRRDYYFLSGPLPEVRIARGDRRHFAEWSQLMSVVFRILHGEKIGDDATAALLPAGASESSGESRFEGASREAKPRAKPARTSSTSPKPTLRRSESAE